MIEYNPTLRPPLSLVVPYRPDAQWDGTNYFGASLEALVRLARSKDYRIVGCNISGGNAFFVRNDLGAVGPKVSGKRQAVLEHQPPDVIGVPAQG